VPRRQLPFFRSLLPVRLIPDRDFFYSPGKDDANCRFKYSVITDRYPATTLGLPKKERKNVTFAGPNRRVSKSQQRGRDKEGRDGPAFTDLSIFFWRFHMKYTKAVCKTVITAAAILMLAIPVMAGNGYGPGDGTGNGGDGPKDGSGYGPGTGDCQGLTGGMATFDQLLVRGGNGNGGNGGGSGSGGGNGHGPGDGTGNGGDGPHDGTGFGPGDGDCLG
jgi:hypothetical protein